MWLIENLQLIWVGQWQKVCGIFEIKINQTVRNDTEIELCTFRSVIVIQNILNYVVEPCILSLEFCEHQNNRYWNFLLSCECICKILSGVDSLIATYDRVKIKGQNERVKWVRSIQRIIHDHDVRALAFCDGKLLSGGTQHILFY